MFAMISGNGWMQICAFFLVLLALVVPLGSFMARVYDGQRTFLSPLLQPLENLTYRLAGITATREMNWVSYALALMIFSAGSFLLLFLILVFQDVLPLNPNGFPGLSPDLAFNTAASFVTNTNWQSYSGELTMSLFSQMAGLTLQNFLSAAAGMAVLVALIRGLSRRSTSEIGNFWVDMVRSVLYILLPLSLVFALFLVSQGVVQTFAGSVDIIGLEGVKQSLQTGPVASQEAIKMLGTNGGGFFNVNSAHPFENPTPLSNFLELVSILVLPAACCHMFGVMVKDRRQGLAILAAMLVIFIPLFLVSVSAEQAGNPHLAALGIDQTVSNQQAGGNMEGKETRFGIVNSALWASATTAASNGSVNAMHDSFTPVGGMVPLTFILLGEIVFGGVGSGLYGMLVFVVITIFIAGLMVGRTPEYLGKKIQSFEIKMASVAILTPCILVLCGTALAVLLPAGQAGVFNPGAQGFSEILYAFASAANNNGSAFAGLSANTPFYNIALGVVMLFGRFSIMIPVLAMAGSLATKKAVPASVGTLPTHTPMFLAILVGVILLVGLLTFAPALALGPVAEQLTFLKG